MHSSNESDASCRLAVTRIGEDRDAAVEILQQTLGMNAIDARTRVAHVPAVWPDAFPSPAAEQAVRQLSELGGIAAAVSEADVPDLRSGRTLHHVRCQQDGLVIMSIAGDPERTILWEDVALLSIADVAGLHHEAAGGLPDGVFRHSPGIVETHVQQHGLEMWLITRSPVSGYRIDAELMNYEYLGERRSRSSEANFGGLVSDIRRHASQLVQTPSALAYDPSAGRPPERMPSPAAHRDAVAACWALEHVRRGTMQLREPTSRPSVSVGTTSTDSGDGLIVTHRRLQAEIEALRTCRPRSGEDAEEARFREELAQQIEQLRATIDEHFRLEEDGGYLKTVLDVAPRHSDAADVLRRQHDALRERLTRLNLQSDRVDELVAEIQQFLAALEAHEHAENALVQSTFEDDIAAGD